MKSTAAKNKDATRYYTYSIDGDCYGWDPEGMSLEEAIECAKRESAALRWSGVNDLVQVLEVGTGNYVTSFPKLEL